MGQPVEFFILGDNKSLSVGEKRNAAINLASGKYVCFVDDDDQVSESYVSELLNACQRGADCVAFNMDYFKDDKYAGLVRFDLVDRNHRDGANYKWMVNHLCPVRRELAEHAQFPDSNLREDFEYAERLRLQLKTMDKIEKTLYTYKFNSQTTETRRQR